MVLVTGATGLLGAHLCYHLLEKGSEVVGIFRNEKQLNAAKEIFGFYENPVLFQRLIWVKADVLDVFSLEEVLQRYAVSEIYHCAGMVSFEEKDVKKMNAVNVTGTANMINVSLQYGVKKFCHVSSVAALGKELHDAPITEVTRWKSVNATRYARSKYSAEREAWRGAEEGLNVVIVNPSVIIGPGCWENSSGRLLKATQSGIRFYTSGSTGMIDVRDAARCCVLLMEHNKFSERFILNAENLSFRQLLAYPLLCFGKPAPSIKISKLYYYLFFRLERLLCVFSGRRPALSKDFLKSGFATQLYSNEKIKQSLQYHFIEAKESFEWTCSFLKKQRK